MHQYKNFIKNIQFYLNEHVFSNRDLKKLDRNQLKKIIKQYYYDYCYSHPEFKKHVKNQSILNFILNENLGLGAIDDLLSQQNISEIMINGPNCIYFEKEGKLILSQLFFSSEQVLRNIINKIAHKANRRLDQSSPMLDARLPDGSRLNAIVYPLALNGMTVTIRRFLHKKMSLKELIESGSLSFQSLHFLKFCVENKKNILVAGGTGSGKTTLLNTLSEFIPSSERIISIEDSAELKLKQPHVVSLETRTKNIENLGEVSIRDLLKNSLRMRPDRIIVGECRSEEILDMLQAMNTGHNGSMTTIHANSPRDAIKRIENLVLMSGYTYPTQALREQIVSSIDIIVFIQRLSSGKRVVSNIVEVSHMEENAVSLLELFNLKNDRLVGNRHFPSFFQKLSDSEKGKLKIILNMDMAKQV